MNNDATPLEAALHRLETQLETPVIPGEMPDWCEAAQHEFEPLEAELNRAVREKHLPLLAEIFELDPEQGARVEQLKKTDAELLVRTDKLKQRLYKLCNASEIAEPNEVRVADCVEETIQLGLQLVIDIRKQEIALATWHGEALKRDRGIAD